MSFNPLPGSYPGYTGALVVYNGQLYRIAYVNGLTYDNSIFVVECPCGFILQGTLEELTLKLGCVFRRELSDYFAGLPCYVGYTRLYILDNEGNITMQAKYSFGACSEWRFHC